MSKYFTPILKLIVIAVIALSFIIVIGFSFINPYIINQDKNFQKLCQKPEIADFKKEYKTTKANEKGLEGEYLLKAGELGEIEKSGSVKSSSCTAGATGSLSLIKKEDGNEKVLFINDQFNFYASIDRNNTDSKYNFEEYIQQIVDDIGIDSTGLSTNPKYFIEIARISQQVKPLVGVDQDKIRLYIISDDRGKTWQFSNEINKPL